MSTIYGVTELARATGMSVDAVRSRCRRGTIPLPSAVLANGRVWTGQEIEQWIRTHRAASTKGEEQ